LTQSGHPACDAKKFLDPNVSYLSQDFRWISLTSGGDGYTAGTASFVSNGRRCSFAANQSIFASWIDVIA
jgi:hypothetical protein